VAGRSDRAEADGGAQAPFPTDSAAIATVHEVEDVIKESGTLAGRVAVAMLVHDGVGPDFAAVPVEPGAPGMCPLRGRNPLPSCL
jgi:hypothetical protein